MKAFIATMINKYHSVIVSSLLSLRASAVTANSLVSPCQFAANLPSVACVSNYAAVMPLPFSRPSSLDASYNPLDRFSNTSVDDPSFALVRDASFVVFDEEVGKDILGLAPTFDNIFDVDNVVHEV